MLSKLQNVNNMYQFSLAAFMVLFTRALKAEMDFKNVEDRLQKLTYDLEKRTLFYVGRGLYKADRLMWAMHMIHGAGRVVACRRRSSPQPQPPQPSSSSSSSSCVVASAVVSLCGLSHGPW